MSNQTVTAKICWLPPEAGGRKTPLAAGMRYCPIVRFEQQSITDGAATDWSADITWTNPLDEQLCVTAQFSFLVEEAPHELLQKGHRFSLYEGSLLVAKGVIL
ncbi:hypothetical protein [Brevibacillus dissolubilis]|uniref:hypothetical protein n=1 Tax=Brevibacillus dissolubilis TaxID=1844116 RepID=UPI0011178650|nr:hypothetical protein [Brevibacillus dissolubilis]